MLKLSFSPFPVLTTDRLILRQITPGDQNEIFDMRSDKRVMQFIGRPRMKSPEEALVLIGTLQDNIDKNEGITWAITMKGAEELMGTIGYWQILKEHFRAEIGYSLRAKFHQKGIMHEAVQRVLDYGFQQMNLHTVQAIIEPGNIASAKLLEKNKFVREGYFREDYFFESKFHDSAVYSLISP